MMRIDSPLTLSEFFEDEFLTEHVNMTENSAQQYRVAIRQLNRFHERPVFLIDLSKELILRFMRALKAPGTRSERTINNKRQAILTIWREAAELRLCDPPGKIPKLVEPTRIVRAWTVDEVSRLLDACEFAQRLDGWDRRHWKALCLTIYDTSHRIGALLQTSRASLDGSGYLLVLARHSKQKTDKLHKLHAETIAAINELPPANLLFPWPKRKRAIWPAFRAILKAAKLPATRKDLFHKIRRTSFTYVYALLGADAAREQAAHSTDMRKSYLDVELLKLLQNRPSPTDVMPRPRPRPSN